MIAHRRTLALASVWLLQLTILPLAWVSSVQAEAGGLRHLLATAPALGPAVTPTSAPAGGRSAPSLPPTLAPSPARAGLPLSPAAAPYVPASAPASSQSSVTAATVATYSACEAVEDAYQTGDFYNISITVVAAASAASNTLSLAEQSARGGDVRSAVIALYVAQETIIAAAAALQKDYSAVVFHTKQANQYLYGYTSITSTWTVESLHLAVTALSASASSTITAVSSSATSEIFEASSSQTQVWSLLMNQTCAATNRTPGFTALGYHFCEISVLTSQQTFGLRQQTDYFFFAYETALICEEVLEVITQIQITSKVSFSAIVVSNAILAHSCLESAGAASEAASVLVTQYSQTQTSVTITRYRTLTILITQAITNQVNYVAYWSATRSVLTESALAIYASTETYRCVESIRTSDYVAARQYAQASYYYSSLTTYTYTSSVLVLIETIQVRTVVVFVQFVSYTSTIITYPTIIPPVIPPPTPTVMPTLPPTLPPLPPIAAPKLAPLTQPIAAPTPSRGSVAPSITPTAAPTGAKSPAAAPAAAPTAAKTPAPGPATPPAPLTPPVIATPPTAKTPAPGSAPPATTAAPPSPVPAARPPSPATPVATPPSPLVSAAVPSPPSSPATPPRAAALPPSTISG